MAKIDGVQEVSLELLKPYENNAKIHSETQVKQIADSISEFGFLNPCLIDKDFNIIAGHGRVMAAKKLGMETVPCIFVEGLTEAQRRAYILADNRLTELGEWDIDTVQFELKELADMNFDIDLTGFELKQEEEYEPINYDGLENGNSSNSHVLKIDSIVIYITEEEYNEIMDRYNNYMEENQVSFGFLTSILEN